MTEYSEVFVAFDTSKTKHAVAVAESGRDGEIRYLGEIESGPEAVERLVRKLAGRYGKVHFCYEAGPTGYGLYRQLRDLGHVCDVVAPSLIPQRPGDRVKTNRRDAVTLARLLRAGELTAVWVPDAVHEAVRDLTRAREAAMKDLRQKRQQLLSFLLRHGRVFTGHRHWSQPLAGRADVRASGAADRLSGSPRPDRGCRSAVDAVGPPPCRDGAGLVDGTGRRGLPGDARRVVSGGGDLRRRDR